MKLLSRVGISLATLFLFAAPTTVQGQVSNCFFPFWGGYGYGYGAPSYGGYYAGYSPMWGAPAPMGLYSASYAPSANCCAPSCCAPSCCDSCGGNCATGACGTSTGTGTLKPSTDENFIQKSREQSEDGAKERTFGTDDEADPNRSYQRERNPGDGFQPGTRRTPATDPATDPASDAGWEKNRNRSPAGNGAGGTESPAGNSDKDSSAPFEPTDNDSKIDNDFPPFAPNPSEQSSNKPPMSDPATPQITDPAADPAGDMSDGFGNPSTDPAKEKSPSDFLDPDGDTGAKPAEESPTGGTNPSAFRSQLREVVPAQRLARRTPAQSGSNFAGRQSKEKATRWISLPLTEGHARL